MIAGILFVGVLSLGAAAFVFAMPDDSDASVATEEADDAPTAEPAASSEEPAEPKADATTADATKADAHVVSAENTAGTATARDAIVWTVDASSTLEELGHGWTIPRDVLVALNPKLPADAPIEIGSKVTVHSYAFPGSISVGSPNDGRLTRGVPLPEGAAWLQPFDRSRAFATVETIAALTAGLEAYGRRFPEAEPIQIGDLSARRGGQISGHQSHQSGRDVDIRLIRDASGEGFDPERNWFLVKTLVDGSAVTAIFLNAKQQTWLRTAAEADVGVEAAAPYFALIRHEKGHTIHMHVRYACPKASHRCVAYPLPDSGEQAPKTTSKLPPLPGKPKSGESKLPVLNPKGGGRLPDKPHLPDKPKKKGKKGKTKTLRPR